MARTRDCRESENVRLFERASRQWDRGELRSAFRLFLAGAKAGDCAAQVNFGNFYSDGIGIKVNRGLGLYWYRRAYRQGERCAASNIGVVFRNEQKFGQALKWFERASKLADGDADLDIAKIYLGARNDTAKAIHYLKRTLKAKASDVTEAAREEAQRLLTGLERKPRTNRA